MTLNPHRRLRSETTDLLLWIKDAAGSEKCHKLAVCLAVDDQGALRELQFVTRGTIGAGLDNMLRDLGISLSRVIQGRDPETGDLVPLVTGS